MGRVRGRHYSVERLQKWTMEVWGHHFSEPPRVQTFVRGWFSLRFKCVAHTNWVLSTIWHIDQAPVLLRRWTPLFNLELERVEARPIWVRLLGLPCHFWIEQIFRQIGDAMGSYLIHYDSFITTRRMAYARILVHMDLSDGFPKYINIQWRNAARRQMLDYEGYLSDVALPQGGVPIQRLSFEQVE